MEITLTDTDGIRFTVAVNLIQEFHRRGGYTEVTICFGNKFCVCETPEEIYKKIMEVKNGGNSDV